MQFRNNYYVNAAFMGITAAVPMLVLVGAISLGKGIPKNLRSLITIVISLIALIFFDISLLHGEQIIVSGLYGAIFLRGKV